MYGNGKQDSQSEQDAVIQRQIWESVMTVIFDNGVMFTRENIYRLARILMAVCVNMVGMSCNNVDEFKEKAKQLIDDMDTVLKTLPDTKKRELMSAVDRQLDFMKKRRKEAIDEFVEEQKKIEKEQVTLEEVLPEDKPN